MLAHLLNKVLKLKTEIEQLKIQELEDRRRIQHLLALTQPVTQEVTFFRDARPGKNTQYPVGDAHYTDRSELHRRIEEQVRIYHYPLSPRFVFF